MCCVRNCGILNNGLFELLNLKIRELPLILCVYLLLNEIDSFYFVFCTELPIVGFGARFHG